ncbi:MAG TPA: RNA methyltransferase [Candidatus Cloacimonadota bacterium]|nr:RNA methyltransferase [Candidatus Cloacimonadota bacterium]
MPNNPLDNVCIILVEPVYGGNVGAVARILNNFCLSHLRIVGSIPQKNDFYLAMHSEQIITEADLFNSLAEAVQDLDRVIAFSRRVGKQKPIDLNPWNLGEYFYPQSYLKLGLVFGRETFGLTDAEADLCPLRCRIPANPNFPSLNLAQAVAVAAWELWSYPMRNAAQSVKAKQIVQSEVKIAEPAVSGEELAAAQTYLKEVLQEIGFFQDYETTNWDNFLAKMLHQLNPSQEMIYRFRQMFNRIHVLVTGKGKGYGNH